MEWRYFLVLAALITIQSGCRSLSPNAMDGPLDKIASTLQSPEQNMDRPSQVANSATGDPSKMVVIWKEDILQSNSGRPIQGFTGRVYFHSPSGEMVKVDGQLSVYGYDDSGTIRKRVPDKHFVFEADKFNDHYAPSELGHSYNIWIPWGEYGGTRKAITLVPVFKTTSDKIVQGTADKLSLSGQAPEGSTLERTIASPQPTVDSMQTGAAMQAGASMQAGAAMQAGRNWPIPPYQQSQANANSIPLPNSIAEQWNRTADVQRLAHQHHLVPPHPPAMNALNHAENQANGRGYNQVHRTQQQFNGPMPQNRASIPPNHQSRQGAMPFEHRTNQAPGSMGQTAWSQPTAPAQHQSYGANRFTGYGGNPMSGTNPGTMGPRTTNQQLGGQTGGFPVQKGRQGYSSSFGDQGMTSNSNGMRSPGFQTSLSDVQPVAKQPRVFGQPGAIR